MVLASEGSLIAGRYLLDDRLDFGGRAQVWSALDQQLDRRVAVKLLATPEGADATFMEEFRAAAELEARLKHPSIVEVLDWGQDGEWNFIVMELLEGQTMARLLKAGPMPPDRVIADRTQRGWRARLRARPLHRARLGRTREHRGGPRWRSPPS